MFSSMNMPTNPNVTTSTSSASTPASSSSASSSQAQAQGGPIKIQGFDTGHSPPPQLHSPLNASSYGFDSPSMLYGGYNHQSSPMNHNKPSHPSSSLPFATSGSAAFSDLDLDFETTLASLAQHHQLHQQQQYQQQSQSSHSMSSLYSGAPGGGSGQTPAQAAYNHPHFQTQPLLDHHQGPSATAGSPSMLTTNNPSATAYGSFHDLSSNRSHLPAYLSYTANGGNNSVSTSSGSSALSSAKGGAYAPSMLPSHSSSSNHINHVASPQDSIGTPATPLTPLLDLYGNPLSPTNTDSPLHTGATSQPQQITQPPRQPASSQTSTSAQQPTQDFGSYSSAQGDSFAPSSVTSKASKRGGSKPNATGTPSSPEATKGNAGRSRSTGVGKAPTSRARSRSARRTANPAYQGPGSPSSTNPIAAIPISKASSSSSSSQPIAMSMPAYTGSGGGGSNSWFGSSGNQPSSIAASLGDGGVSSLGSNSTTATTTDPQTGWKPTRADGLGMPASAPTLGAAKKGKSMLDDVPEDPNQKQAAAALTEKRRKRRESHNAVERRRRDNINDRITELASLLPELLLEQVSSASSAAAAKAAASGSAYDEFEDTADGESFAALSLLSPDPSGGGGPSGGLLGTSPTTRLTMLGTSKQMSQGAGAAAAAAVGKPNKGIILAKSVEYIRYLQQLLELHSQRASELENLIEELRADRGIESAPPPPQHSQDAFENHFGGREKDLFGDFDAHKGGERWRVPKEEEMDQS